MSRRGFTLIELMLATAMTAMLALSLFASLSVAFHARRTAAGAVDPLRALNVAVDLLARDLQNVPPPTGLLKGTFIGTHQAQPGPAINNEPASADNLDFRTLSVEGPTDSPLRDGIHEVYLMLRNDVNPPVLVRQAVRNLLSTVQQNPEEEVLLRNVRSFALRYYDGSTWQEEWDSEAQGQVLPMAVGMTIAVDNPSATTPDAPPLVMTRIIPLSCARVLDVAPSQGQ